MADSSIEVPRKRKSDSGVDTSTELPATIIGVGVTTTVAKRSKTVEGVNTLISDELIATNGSEVDVDHIYHQPTVSNAEESNVEASEELSENEFDDELGDEYSYEDGDVHGDDDSVSREYGVEEREITIQQDSTDKVAKLRLFLTKDDEFADCLHMIHVSCTVDGKRIGHAFGQYICWEEIREDFWSEMEAPSRALSLVAFKLFDRYEYLNGHLKNHCVQKGTGVWGDELDFGSLFLLEHIEVTEREWRRKGLGRAMIGDLVKKAEVLHKPSPLNTPGDNMFEDMFWFGRNKERERRAKTHIISMPGYPRHDVEPQYEGKSEPGQHEIYSTRREHGMMTIVIADNFAGFTSDATRCQFLLMTGSMPTKLSDAQLLLQLKCGCTCGECIGGFLSPRMKLALLFQAETYHDSLNDSIHMSLGEDGVDWLWLQEDLVEHVHPDLQRNFKTNKSLRQGFANMFNYIAICLKANKPPTRKNVLRVWEGTSEWPPVTCNYLQWGGTLENKIEAVLEKVFEGVHAQNEIFGDGEFMNCMEEEVERLKICRNDHEYGFVAKSCGLPERSTNPSARLEGIFQRMLSGMQ